jgi:hypothetical protein
MCVGEWVLFDSPTHKEDGMKGLERGRALPQNLKEGVTKHVIPEQWAYIAGIVDGEGCITKHNTQNSVHGYMLAVAQKDVRLLDWLTNTLGVGRRATRQASGVSVWNVTGQRAVHDTLVGIRPYLIVKGEQADIAIAYIRARYPTIYGE